MKKLFPLIIFLTYFFVYANSAFAISLCPSTTSGFSGLCNVDLNKAVGSLVTFAYIIAIIVALFYLIWGGLKWLMSGGDKAAVQQARDHLIGAIIGLVIIFLSYVILSLIAKFFLGSTFSLSNIVLPKFGQ